MVSIPFNGNDCVSGTYTVSENDIIVVVLGVKGSGKSNFISRALGVTGAPTHKVVAHPMPLKPDCNLVLVDTPDFDDVNGLRAIVQWLASSYKNGAKLHGLLFLYNITNNPMPSSTVRLLSLFRQLCGEEALPGTVLVTTMSGREPKPVAEARESEPIENYWQAMIASGSRAERFNDTTDDAFRIIKRMLTAREIVLSIQRELVDEKKLINDTAVGASIRLELAIQKEMENARKLEALRQETRYQQAIIGLLGGLLATSVAGFAWLVQENRASVAEVSLQFQKELATLKVMEQAQETATSAWLFSSISTFVSAASSVMSSVSASTLSPTLASAGSFDWRSLVSSSTSSEGCEEEGLVVAITNGLYLFVIFLILSEIRRLH